MDGTVWAWGSNTYGQLGDNSTENRLLPVQVHGEMDRGFLTGVTSVVCGPEHTLALLSDGTVWAWGRNNYGQLGNGTSGEEFLSSTPVNVLNLTNVIAIAANNNQWDSFSLALKDDGTVWAWGRNRYGQLGNGISGEDAFSSTPVQVTGLANIVAVAAGGTHALALKNDGTVWAWGSNNHGQVGDGTNQNIRTTPVQVKGLDGVGYLTDVLAIAAGYRFSMALKNDGTVWFWGYNEFYLFGDPLYNTSPLGHSSPVQRSYTELDTSIEMVFLTMEVLPEGAGTTVPIESIHAYNPGTVVNLRAEAKQGYRFSHWSEGDNLFLPDTTITMDSSKTVTAIFEQMYPDIGDINKDGVINVQDVILCLRMSIKLPVTIGFQTKASPYPQERIAVADINSDGQLTH